MPAAASDKYSVRVLGEEAIEEAPWLKKFNLKITDKSSGEVKYYPRWTFQSRQIDRSLLFFAKG